MSDVESRLRRQLLADAEALPVLPGSARAAIRLGRRRRRRSVAVSTLAVLTLLAGLTLGAVEVFSQHGSTGGVVVAEQPELTDEPAVTDPPIVADRSPAEDPAVDTTPKQLSTPAIIGDLPSDSVLFHTDHEGCADVENPRAHPEWIEGQPPSDDDSGSTYGFAFKSNDIRLADGGTESLSALSFQAGRTPDEPFMSLNVYPKATCGDSETCQSADTITQLQPIAVPVGQWIHFEAHVVSRPDTSGRLEVWQDG